MAGIFAVFLLAVLILNSFMTKLKNSSNHAPASLSSDFKDSTYIIDGKAVTLRNGVSVSDVSVDSSSETITRFFGNEAIGDLNNDGKDDVAFILTQEGGGSGTFYYGAVALESDKGYIGLNTILLGDRISPQTTEISDGKVTFNYADRNINDPMTTPPSVGVSRYLKVINNELVVSKVENVNPVNDKSDLITVDNLASGQIIGSPLSITGKARGAWFFEASFPVKLYDENGGLITSAIAQADLSDGGTWMTDNFVPFKVTVEFNNSTSTNGTLVFKKDNPSGLAQNDDELDIPIKFK